MTQKGFKVKISYKIFGVAVSLILLLGLVAFTSQNSLRTVGMEVKDLVAFVVPITNHVNEFCIDTLEQEAHIARILKLNEYEHPNHELIDKEKDLFKEGCRLKDQNITKAVHMAKEAVKEMKTEINRLKMIKIVSFFEKFKKKDRDFQGHAEEILKLLESGDPEKKIHQMELKLEVKKDHLNKEVEKLLYELGSFMVNAVMLSESHHKKVMRNGIIITVAAVFLGLIFALLVTLGMVRPLKYLTDRTQNFMSGATFNPIQVKSRDEMAELTHTFNHMIEELEEKERLKNIFGNYIDPRIVERLEDGGKSLATNGEKKIVSVLISNMEGFSLIASSLEPEQLVEIVNRYLDLFSPSITGTRGFIEFVATEILGFWAEPFVSADEHAILAAESALEQISKFHEFHKSITKTLKDQSREMKDAIACIDITVGIATGPLILANMGPKWSMVYTVLGDTVNTAARLRGVAGHFGVRIILLEETYALIKEKIAARELGLVQVVGKEDKLRIYELLGHKKGLSQNSEKLIKKFAEGLQSYRERHWPKAQEHFRDCLGLKPEDSPTLKYLNRIDELKGQTLTSGWDGVWKFTKKSV